MVFFIVILLFIIFMQAKVASEDEFVTDYMSKEKTNAIKGIFVILIIFSHYSQYVELDLNGSILFESGEAEIREDSKLFLQKIASILGKYKYSIIEIEGHTDNVPISTSRYDNNRELSAERARSVYEYIMTQEKFIDSNMKIAGYGESRPIASNATEEGRARNRRVTIKIYNQQNSND